MPTLSIPDETVMRFVDGELAWWLRIPILAALPLSPALRHQVRAWRRLSATVRSLGENPAATPRDRVAPS